MIAAVAAAIARHPVVTADLRRVASAPLPWGQLAGRTVVVSGATGMLGAYLVEALLVRNELDPAFDVRVVGLVRDRARARRRFAAYDRRPDLSLVDHDVRRPLEVHGAADVIVHAASPASPRRFLVDPVGTIAANTIGTEQLLRLARDAAAERFLFISSGEVYGEVDPSRVPTREDDYGLIDPTSARSCYAEGKRLGEALCAAYLHQHGVPARIVRPFHTYGPGVRLDDGRVFADLVADVLHRRPLTLHGDGRARRAFCYLADAVEGFLTVLLRGEPGRAYNVGSDEETSVADLASLLGEEFGLDVVRRPRPGREPYAESPISRNCPDISRVRALGWAPSTELRDGFRRTVESFRPATEDRA